MALWNSPCVKGPSLAEWEPQLEYSEHPSGVLQLKRKGGSLARTPKRKSHTTERLDEATRVF